ncbi:MAG: CPBP family intramembrane metalloprotease [Planctomycetes bacterium]|nr:CPBP family intramembrane metalloprotease [Planctomycetota bacterium]
MPQPKSRGAWPYWLPYVGFISVIAVMERVPEAVASNLLAVQLAVPLGFLVYFGIRSSYPELGDYRMSLWGLTFDLLVGVVGAALWMAPYLIFDSLRSLVPVADTGLGVPQIEESWGSLRLILRAVGFCLVTPLMEELFVRSWLQRYADVFDKPADFRDVSIAHFSGRSFVLVIVWFTFSHQSWEWPVAAAWLVMTQFWFYYRKSLAALVIVHAITNLTIFTTVLLASGVLHDAAGRPISLWFFL